MMTEKATGGAKGSPLRQRMIEQMRIANLAESTQIAYLFEIERLAKHYGCQRRSKISPPGRSKTSPLNVMRYAVLGGCPGSP